MPRSHVDHHALARRVNGRSDRHRDVDGIATRRVDVRDGIRRRLRHLESLRQRERRAIGLRRPVLCAGLADHVAVFVANLRGPIGRRHVEQDSVPIAAPPSRAPASRRRASCALTANSTMHWHWLIATSATPASVERGSTVIFSGGPPPPPSATLCDAWPGRRRSIGVDPLAARVLVAIGRSCCDPAHQQAADQGPERAEGPWHARGVAGRVHRKMLAQPWPIASGTTLEKSQKSRDQGVRSSRARIAQQQVAVGLRLEPRRGVPVVAPRVGLDQVGGLVFVSAGITCACSAGSTLPKIA